MSQQLRDHLQSVKKHKS